MILYDTINGSFKHSNMFNNKKCKINKLIFNCCFIFAISYCRNKNLIFFALRCKKEAIFFYLEKKFDLCCPFLSFRTLKFSASNLFRILQRINRVYYFYNSNYAIFTILIMQNMHWGKSLWSSGQSIGFSIGRSGFKSQLSQKSLYTIG